MRSVSDKSSRETQNTHFVFCNFVHKSYHLRDNVEKYGTAGQGTDDNVIRRMRIACCIPKATNRHLEYVILILFQLQQWLHERTSMLSLHVRILTVWLSFCRLRSVVCVFVFLIVCGLEILKRDGPGPIWAASPQGIVGNIGI